jgi:hypothetical protein
MQLFGMPFPHLAVDGLRCLALASTEELCRPERSGPHFPWQSFKQTPLFQAPPEARLIQSPPEKRLATCLELPERECFREKAKGKF